MPIGNVACKLFEVVWKNSKTPDRKQLTDIHIDKLNKHLSNNMVRVIVSPTKLWSNSTSYGVQFEVARLEFEQAPRYGYKELDKFDDDDDDGVSLPIDACSVVNDDDEDIID